jgi:hypothetical protein
LPGWGGGGRGSSVGAKLIPGSTAEHWGAINLVQQYL